VGWVDEEKMNHCRWKKQPSTREELEQAFAIFDGQELGCHRYAGTDPAILQRIGFDSCDFPVNGPWWNEPQSELGQAATCNLVKGMATETVRLLRT
jgi:hypothetical protein